MKKEKFCTKTGSRTFYLTMGDPAYPLLPWLMKVCPDNGSLLREQKNFNYRLSKARVVEHAYGRLKGRWRCLLERNDILVSDLPEVVAACCVLHNICEIHGESFDEDWMQDVTSQDSVNSPSTSSASSVDSDKSIREALMSHFRE